MGILLNLKDYRPKSKPADLRSHFEKNLDFLRQQDALKLTFYDNERTVFVNEALSILLKKIPTDHSEYPVLHEGVSLTLGTIFNILNLWRETEYHPHGIQGSWQHMAQSAIDRLQDLADKTNIRSIELT